MSEIKAGDRVKYPAGRGGGTSEGRVIGVVGDRVEIETANGKRVFRKVTSLEKV